MKRVDTRTHRRALPHLLQHAPSAGSRWWCAMATSCWWSAYATGACFAALGWHAAPISRYRTSLRTRRRRAHGCARTTASETAAHLDGSLAGGWVWLQPAHRSNRQLSDGGGVRPPGQPRAGVQPPASLAHCRTHPGCASVRPPCSQAHLGEGSSKFGISALNGKVLHGRPRHVQPGPAHSSSAHALSCCPVQLTAARNMR
jgi:hypothetical protein